MPSKLRASSPSKRPASPLIVALSGRALAAAAHRAGETPIVMDLYADVDTASYSETCVRLCGGPHDFDRAYLCDAVISFRPQVPGLVYGAGFEGDTDLLAEIAELVPLIGNPPSVVAAVKHPLHFAALLDRLGIPHPETRSTPPITGVWLHKQAGASGGGHIGWGAASAAGPGAYFQKAVLGRPLSVLFIANGREMRIVGYSEQWPDPTASQPFRYGGCAGPVAPPPRLAAMIAEACDTIVAATGLLGLNSLDMIVDGDGFHVLEINPRPGATLDIFDDRRLPLWRLHCLAVRGELAHSPDVARAIRAAAILYAPRRMAMPAARAWPHWMADRSVLGTVFEAGDPICTVRASAGTVAEARAILARRARHLLECLVETPPRPSEESAHAAEAL